MWVEVVWMVAEGLGPLMAVKWLVAVGKSHKKRKLSG